MRREKKTSPSGPVRGRGKTSARKGPRPAARRPAAKAKTPARKTSATATGKRAGTTARPSAPAPARRPAAAARKPAVGSGRKSTAAPARKPAARVKARRAARVEPPLETPAAPAKTRTRSADRTAAARPRAPRGAPGAPDAVRKEPERTTAAAAGLPAGEFVFPETYGKTRVRLLMQSPGRLFVHWDLSPAVVEDLKAQVGQRAASLTRLAIRVTTPGAARPLIVLLPRGARSWYVDVPGQRQEYRAEIGLMLPSGEFRPIAASNVIRTPRTAPSPVAASGRVAVRGGEAIAPDALPGIPPDEPAPADEWEEPGPEEGGPAGEGAAPGGSSERLARGPAAARRRRPRPGELGGASDLAPAGSSSDLRPRR